LIARAAALALLAAVAAGCGSSIGMNPEAGSTFIPFVPAAEAQELPLLGVPGEGRIGATGGIIFAPVSLAVADGVPYRFNLGHCGLHSPVDVDGSFWDAIAGVNAEGLPLDLANDGEMINQTAGVLIVVGDQALFRTETGSIITFARHVGEKEFPGCA
jgi:hypothetical protein